MPPIDNQNPQSSRRLPIVATLFALMFIQVVLAVIVTTAAGAWNLSRGFSDYLLSREEELLDAFVAELELVLSESGGVAALVEDPHLIRTALDRIPMANRWGESPPPPFEAGDGRPPPPPYDNEESAPPRFDHSREAPPMPDRAHGGFGPPGRTGLPRPDNFGGRIGVYVDGDRLIAGFGPSAGSQTLVRPVRHRGEVVAQARTVVPAAPGSTDIAFLARQMRAAIAAGLALLVLGGLIAWLIARVWVRPLLAIQVQTARVANGEFDRFIKPSGPKEIAATIVNINGMIASIRQLESARRRWLADISHELRTPVTVLRGEIEGFIDGVRKPTPEAIVSLHEEVLSIGALIEDVHLIALSDIGKIQCQFRETTASFLTDRAIKRFTPHAEAKGLSLHFDAPASDGDHVWADPARIDQVLNNILANAIQYTNAPGDIFAYVEVDQGAVSIIVEDSAPVPSESEIAQLFQPFYRTEDSRSRASGGSGLGLAVCKAIVDSHGGAIAASPSQHGGLRVEVRLTRRVEDNAQDSGGGG